MPDTTEPQTIEVARERDGKKLALRVPEGHPSFSIDPISKSIWQYRRVNIGFQDEEGQVRMAESAFAYWMLKAIKEGKSISIGDFHKCFSTKEYDWAMDWAELLPERAPLVRKETRT